MLDVKNVTVRFGGVVAIDNLSFQLNQGELLGLIGPNGAGKTTAMRVITGVVKQVAGEVFLDGKSLEDKAPFKRIRAGIGLSQQIVKPFRMMSVLENVAFAAGSSKTAKPVRSMLHVKKEQEKEFARTLLQQLGIADLENARPANLPLGSLKRLELARALALKPKLLLLDEPLAGLNQMEAEKLSNTLLELNSKGQTIILIEHNLKEVIRICERLVVIDNGVKLKEGNPVDVMEDKAVRAAYLGEE